jgi:thymidylate kinase
VTTVSFSGIDGSGKSTQIFALERLLQKSGLQTRVVTFWDDIAVLSRFRESVSREVFHGAQGVGSPANPIERRDKNVASWPVVAARFCLYFADAINLRLTLRKLRKETFHCLIFDRYIYDELANLPLNGSFARMFAQSILKLVPKPDFAYLIDADPGAAFSRKPEYPIEFLHFNRQSYLTLARLDRTITVINPGSIQDTEAIIGAEVLPSPASS